MSYSKWYITPTEVPKIKKHCSKCGKETTFSNSYRFRVNANGKALDIWMIFNCDHCKTSYNLTLYERISPSTLPANQLNAFMNNCCDLIETISFNPHFYVKNKVTTEYNPTAYHIKKTGSIEGNVELVMTYSLPIRVDKFLSQELNLSRSALKALIEKEHITFDGSIKYNKSHIKNGMKIFMPFI